ncbi:hypothetical protein BGZ47_007280 [Haplosporangium gracile]|nr:hypothetical protein BGZ47_007280 [Haplosporangium gracile]
MPSIRRQRAALSLKVDIINAHDGYKRGNVKVTYRCLADKFGVSEDTVSKTIHVKDRILAQYRQSPENAEQGTNVYSRNMLPVENALMEWFRMQQKRGIRVLEKNLRAEALVI